MKFHTEGLGKKQTKILHKTEMLDLYRRKFNISDISHVLYGLVYFDDAELERMPKMLLDVGWAEIKQAIQSWVKILGQ